MVIFAAGGGYWAGFGILIERAQYHPVPALDEISFPDAFCLPQSELIFGKGMRTATFQFSESGSSLNDPDLFTELPFL